MSEKGDDLNLGLDEEFGDLFKDSEVKPEQKQTVAVQPAPAPAPKAPAPAPVSPAPAAQPAETATKKSEDGFVSFGAKVSREPIPRFKATASSKSRIALISKGVLPLKTHYVEGLGSIVCFEGKCCELEGMPRVRYIMPVVQYEVKKDGTPVSDEIELKGLVLGGEQYDALVNAIQCSGRAVNDVDIIITCTDEGYQKISFAAAAGDKCLWKTFPKAREIIEYFKANKDKLYLCIARKVPEDVYLNKKGLVKVPESKPVDNFDDLGIDD